MQVESYEALSMSKQRFWTLPCLFRSNSSAAQFTVWLHVKYVCSLGYSQCLVAWLLVDFHINNDETPVLEYEFYGKAPHVVLVKSPIIPSPWY